MFLDYLELAIALASIGAGISMVWRESSANRVRKRTPSLALREIAHS